MAQKITQAEIDARAVSNMPIRPNDRSSYGMGGMNAAQVRARFDALALLVIARYNELIEEIESGELVGENDDKLTKLLADVLDGNLSGRLQVYDKEGGLTSLQNVLQLIYSEAIGEQGEPGVGVAKVEQTVASTADNGENVITVTLTDGSTATFTVRNGSRGSTGAKGDPGADGKDGVGVAKVEQIATSTADSGVNVFRITLTNGGYTDIYVQNGARGKEGDPGADGHTPVRGTDYWTPADKAEVIAEVLSKFTNAAEVAM